MASQRAMARYRSSGRGALTPSASRQRGIIRDPGTQSSRHRHPTRRAPRRGHAGATLAAGRAHHRRPGRPRSLAIAVIGYAAARLRHRRLPRPARRPNRRRRRGAQTARTIGQHAGQEAARHGKGFGRSRAAVRAAGRSPSRRSTGTQLSLATEDGWTRTITVTVDHRHHQGRPDDHGHGDLQGRRRDPLQPDPQRRRVVHDHRDHGPTARSPAARSRPSTATTHHRQGQGATRPGSSRSTASTVYQARHGGRLQGRRQGRVRGRPPQGTVERRHLHRDHRLDRACRRSRGEVTGKTADTITVKRKRRLDDRHPRHVDKTTYEIRGDKTASLADIAVGDRVAP